MTHEELLGQVNVGRSASVALQFLMPLFSEIEKELTTSMKVMFKNGKQTEMTMACHTAQLCLLDELREKLKSLDRVGQTSFEQIEKKEYDDGEPEHYFPGT